MEKQVYSRPKADAKSIAYYQKREALKILSQRLQPLKTVLDTHLNDLILGHYSYEQGKYPDDFKTYMAWQIAGYRVKRGETGFATWSRPNTVKMGEEYQKRYTGDRKSTPKEVLGEDEFSYYSMTYLFHSGQIEKVKKGGKHE
jgi:hypothetical protein